jgi:hypothetical protein
MKNALDHPPGQKEFPPLLSHRILIATISIMTMIMVFLLADIFYVQFPLVIRTGDANLQRWIGPDAVRITGILLGLLFGASYLATAIVGTRGYEHVRAWKMGAAVGGFAGVIVFLMYLITGLIPISSSELLVPELALYGFMFAGSLIIGIFAGAIEGRIIAATVAGFWFGVILALVAGLGILVRDALFAHHLASTVWLSDHFGDLTCQRAKGSILIGCEVGDDIGFAANTLLMLPLLGMLLGTIGGSIRHLLLSKKVVPAGRWNASIVAPIVCMGFLFSIFIIEALFNLW